jgi:hypothetical protein
MYVSSKPNIGANPRACILRVGLSAWFDLLFFSLMFRELVAPQDGSRGLEHIYVRLRWKAKAFLDRIQGEQ